MDKTKIALTSGCVKGVGPEIAVSAAAKVADKYDITIYGNAAILEKAAKLKGINTPLKIRNISAPYHDVEKLSSQQCGVLAFESLDTAVADVLLEKHNALVTAPINKLHWKKAGLPFMGHTEFLAKKTGTEQFAMMMSSPRLKVTLATIHEAIQNVASSLSAHKIMTAATLTDGALKKYFGITHPKIAIAGLNPHCGDGGLIGSEEDEIIRPAIALLQKNGVGANGPYSADSVFAQAVEGKFDAVVAMYHDQGLGAVKTLDNKNTINITLGIPIIRTSVDHGTAEDIAWTGKADDSNLIAAIEMAGKMVNGDW